MLREVFRHVPEPWGCSKSFMQKNSCAFFVPYLQRRKNNININSLGRIPDGRTPGKEPFFQTQKVYAKALFYCKRQGIPNINFS